MTIKAQIPVEGGIRTIQGQRVAVHRMARRGDDLVRVEAGVSVLDFTRENALALAKRLTASAR